MRKRIFVLSAALLCSALLVSCGDTKTMRGGPYSFTAPKTWKQIKLEKSAPFTYQESLVNFMRAFYPALPEPDSEKTSFRQYNEDDAARFWSAAFKVPGVFKKKTAMDFIDGESVYKTIHNRVFIIGNVPNEQAFSFAAAMRGGKLYVFGIDAAYSDKSAVFESIKIKPLGFFTGTAEGFLRPFLLSATQFGRPLQKYAEPHSWLYGLGFGIGFFFGGMIWFMIAVMFFFIISPVWLRGLSPKQAKERNAEKSALREKKRKQQEEERKRREEEERWNTMSFDQRLAVIEDEAQSNLMERKKELQAAKREYSSLRSQFGGKDPETAFLEHMSASGDAFSAKFKDFYSDSGVQDAQFAMMGFQAIAKYAVAGYCVAVCEARQEDAKLTANRRKAVEYAGALKEIYAKLTAKQKKREITSEAENLKIGAVNIKIPDAIRGIETLSIQLADGRKENLLQTLKGYPEFRKTVNLGNGLVSAGAYLAVAGISFALEKWSDAQEIKQKLEKEVMSIFEKIGKIKTKETKVKAFAARAKELNMALEKALEAYAKIFGDIYDSLYPEGDEEKSKAAREKRKAEGGTYFSDEESEAVTQLFTAGKFLLQLADTPFEGDDAENADEK